jgi:hypothetical protein
MRDPGARTGLPSLRLPHHRPWRGARRHHLLLRPLRQAGRCQRPTRPRLGIKLSRPSVNVRYGSLADIRARIRDVRFTPNSGHAQRRASMSAKCQNRRWLAGQVVPGSSREPAVCPQIDRARAISFFVSSMSSINSESLSVRGSSGVADIRGAGFPKPRSKIAFAAAIRAAGAALGLTIISTKVSSAPGAWWRANSCR